MVSVTHAKVSARSDVADATLVRPSDWNAVHTITDLATPQCGKLVYSSSSALLFQTFNGDEIKIGGTIYPIPSGGISLGSTNVNAGGVPGSSLSGDTSYLVGIYDTTGAGALGPYYLNVITSHSRSTYAGNIGTEIVGGSNTISLVGMCRTSSDGRFVNAVNQRFVISWFNRAPLALIGNQTVGVTTTSTVAVELSSAARAEFLTWGDIAVGIEGTFTPSSGGIIKGNVGIDGTTKTLQQDLALSVSANANGLFGAMTSYSPSEGYHYLTPTVTSPSSTNSVTCSVSAAGLIYG